MPLTLWKYAEDLVVAPTREEAVYMVLATSEATSKEDVEEELTAFKPDEEVEIELEDGPRDRRTAADWCSFFGPGLVGGAP